MRRVQGKNLGRRGLLRRRMVWVILAASLLLNGYFLVRKFGELGEKRGGRVERVARVVDGDTFDTSSGERVRLAGADAPEYGKGCLGEEAKERLEELILGKKVVVRKVSKDHFGRLVGFVFREDFFVDKAMVEEGLAKASSGEDEEYGVSLLTAENQAKEAGRGVWSEKCYPPKRGCLIKGNFRRDRGTKVYHLPGCFNYEKIVVNEKEGDRWFCGEKEAKAAGFRKSKDCPE